MKASDYKGPVGPVINGLYTLNTGDWRTQYPVIDQDKCKKCGACLMYCPVNSIQKIDDSFRVKRDYCKGCGVCAAECRFDALTMVVGKGEE